MQPILRLLLFIRCLRSGWLESLASAHSLLLPTDRVGVGYVYIRRTAIGGLDITGAGVGIDFVNIMLFILIVNFTLVYLLLHNTNASGLWALHTVLLNFSFVIFQDVLNLVIVIVTLMMHNASRRTSAHN